MATAEDLKSNEVEEPVVEEAVSDEVALQQMMEGFNGVAPAPEESKNDTGGETTGDSPAGEPAPASSNEPGSDRPGETTPSTDARLQQEPINPADVKRALELLQVVPDLRSAVEKLRGDAFGKIGGIERVLKSIQESTPFGQEIKVEESDLEELSHEFPETTRALAPALTRVLKKFKGTAPAAAPVNETEIIERAVKMADEIAYRKVAARFLSRDHRDWRTIVGNPDEKTEFRTWLKAKGEAVETKILSSVDPEELSECLSDFKKEQKERAEAQSKASTARQTKPAQSDARTQRLAEAVHPKGGRPTPPSPKKKTDEDEFLEGFNSGPGGQLTA